jgi:hypothetical protein
MDIGLVNGVVPIDRFADDLKSAGVFEEPLDSLAVHRVIFNQQHASLQHLELTPLPKVMLHNCEWDLVFRREPAPGSAARCLALPGTRVGLPRI